MKKYQIVILFALLIALISQTPVSADMGSKPEMHFTFVQENGNPNDLAIISGTLYECDLSDCSDAHPLEEMGPQRFECETFSCYSMAYGYAEYLQLEITFEDGITRKSPVFTKEAFQANYQVTLLADNTLQVEEIPEKKKSLLLALIFTLFVELLLGYLYARKKDFSLKRFLLGIFIVNLITNPLFNLIILSLPFYFALIFGIFGEIVIILFEGVFIYFFMKKEIGFWKSLLLSFSFNLASMILGFFLPV